MQTTPEQSDQVAFPVEIKSGPVPLPPGLAPGPNSQPSTLNSQPPPGWWSLPDLSGSLEGVIRAIEARADIPTHWKIAITSDLRAACGQEFNFVYLDAHYQLEKGNAVLHYHAVPDKKLL